MWLGCPVAPGPVVGVWESALAREPSVWRSVAQGEGWREEEQASDEPDSRLLHLGQS